MVVLHVAPSGDVVEPTDVDAYAAVVDQNLAYGEAGAIVSCAIGNAAAAEDRAEVGDPAFAYAHLDHPVAVPEVHADAADLVPAPYAVDPVEVLAAAGTDYAATGMVRGFARVAPLDSAPGAEA